MNAIEIRAATLTDAKALAECVDFVARERKYLNSTQGFGTEATAAFTAAIKASNGIQLVAVSSNQIVGWCDISFLPFEGFAHSGRLGLGVLPEFRQQQLGSKLLQKVLETAFANALERVELEVFASNFRGIKLYQKFGFIEEGRKSNARKLDGVYDDIVLMAIARSAWNSNH